MAEADRDWLKQQLAAALGWDPSVAEGIVQAIATAESQQEVEELVQEFLGGGDKARSLVHQFQTKQATMKGPEGASLKPYYKGEGDLDDLGYGSAVASSSHAGPSHTPAAATKRATRAPQQQIVDMRAEPASKQQDPGVPSFGSNIRTTVKAPRKGKGAAVDGKGQDARRGPTFERGVANCLCCGKIYNNRVVTNDLLEFLEYGGMCTQCGASVSLTHNGQTETRDMKRQQAGQAGPSKSVLSKAAPEVSSLEQQPDAREDVAESNQASAVAPADDATLKAIAFKDRLVEYDRDAAKRTSVIDDQSDYFEIDTNSWLTDEERQQLRQRRQEIEEAEAARRNQFKVTLDLLGRRVLMADDPEAAELAGPSQERQDAQVAAAATAREIPQGGGTSTSLAGKAGGLSTGPQSQALRIAANPSLLGPSPMFIRPEQEPSSSSRSNNIPAEAPGAASGPSASARNASSRHKGRPVGSLTASKSAASNQRQPHRTRPRFSRVQHDDPFIGPDIVVA
ncbi:hypothetical protein WJX74_008665 [Apatococcus lobatus]|uniref:Activating signal cointegrator 1 third domain-containing protein n=1 Tax=Apatococcus lobatus TaxID=904363 RepID=A0AAW1RSZ8_9CHLO